METILRSIGGSSPPEISLSVWWARQDSNLGPRDSHIPAVSGRGGLSHHPQHLLLVGCGKLEPVIKGTKAPR